MKIFFFFFEKEMKKFRGCFTKVCRFLWEARIVMYFFGENEQMPFFFKKKKSSILRKSSFKKRTFS